jgi:hypothetical protein
MQRNLSEWFHKSDSSEKSPTLTQSSSANQEPGTSENSVEPPKKKHCKRFQNSWLSEFSWLRFDKDNGKMFCLTCETYEKNTKKCLKSAFTIGTNNFQRSALVRHQKCDDHNVSCNAKKQQSYMTAAVKIVQKKYEPILEAQLRTALYMAKENIANRKFLSLIDLQVDFFCSK